MTKPLILKKILGYVQLRKALKAAPFLLVVIIMGIASLSVFFYWKINPASYISDLERAEIADNAIAEADRLSAAGDPSSAVQTLKDYISVTTTTKNKFEALLELARIYFEDKKYNEALKTYKEAEKINPKLANQDLRFLIGISQSAELSSANEEALGYYRKLLAILESKNPQDNDDKEFLEDIQSKVSYLENAVEKS